MVKDGHFREELFYRLNVIDIALPPLRDRKIDIPLLADHFLQIYGAKYHRDLLVLSKDAENALMVYDFPGNVRELENIIERAIILTKKKEIKREHLPGALTAASSSMDPTMEGSFQSVKQKVIEQFEREFITRSLKNHQGIVARAAKSMKIDPKNLFQKIKKYHIDPSMYKKPG
jgi:DNA-binding NtrC family response regulator